MALLQGNSGQTSKQVGQALTVGFGETSDVMVTELQARYYENTYRGNKFGVTFPTALGAFCLFNPASSGKNLVINDIIAQLITFTAGATVVPLAIVAIANQTPTSTGAGTTPTCTLIGSSNGSVAKTFVSGTIVGAPTVAFRHLAGWYTDLAAGDMGSSVKDEVAGAICIAPGSGIQVVAFGTPSTNTVSVSMTWDEIPV
jgi:hypothetical protein